MSHLPRSGYESSAQLYDGRSAHRSRQRGQVRETYTAIDGKIGWARVDGLARRRCRRRPGRPQGMVCAPRGWTTIGTLVEHTTRYLLLLHLPDGREAIEVNEAIRPPSPRCPRSWSAPLPGSGQGTPATSGSALTPASPCTSAIRTVPGLRRARREPPRCAFSEARMRIPTACSASTFRRERPRRPQRRGPRTGRRQPQQPSPQDARIHGTIREAGPASCADRLCPANCVDFSAALRRRGDISELVARSDRRPCRSRRRSLLHAVRLWGTTTRALYGDLRWRSR